MVSNALFTAPFALALSLLLICSESSARPKLIAIDAGHTLEAPGARAAGDGAPESGFNQKMAGYLSEELIARGARTRLANFPERAKENFVERAGASIGADFFVSVHHDSAEAVWLTKLPTDPGAPSRYEDRKNLFSGFSIFLSRKAPNIDLSRRCASAAGAALMAAGERPSLYHGDPTFGKARPFFDKARGTHYFDGLAVLRNSNAPGFLWEVGVIVNPGESARLRQDAVARKMAAAMAQALVDCLGP